MIAPEFNGTPNTEEYRAYLALLLREVFIGTAETVPLDHAAGRILAQDVTARMDDYDRRAHPQGIRCGDSRGAVGTYRVPRPSRVFRSSQRED